MYIVDDCVIVKSMDNLPKQPRGELAIRALPMPSNTNPNGDIFGGWLVSQMDLAGLSVAARRSKSRVTTVAIDKIVFMKPVHVGDFVCCYAELMKVGCTSMQVKIEVWAIGTTNEHRHQVTEGVFTYVAIDKAGRPTPVDHS